MSRSEITKIVRLENSVVYGIYETKRKMKDVTRLVLLAAGQRASEPVAIRHVNRSCQSS